MSLIEKAAQRLDSIPSPSAVPTASPSLPVTEATPTAEPMVARAPTIPEATGAVTERQFDLDLQHLHNSGFITPKHFNSVLAEELRAIKRPLLANVENTTTPIRKANLIMVTSALPQEGKSFTAINLAIAIAMELDRTVLLVDADVARPSVLPKLGIPEQVGLLDVLRGKYKSVGDVLLRTNIDKLTILPAGTHDAQATELLASQAMERLLNEISMRYSNRVVIFDAPPLLVTSEARVLATGMGQIVFVVKAEETPKAAVQEALATIENCEIKMMVLNQMRGVERSAYGYGSYGTYGTAR